MLETSGEWQPSRFQLGYMNIVDSFDASRLFLGKLCNYGHNWKETGQSLRRFSGHGCDECERLRMKANANRRRSESFSEEAFREAETRFWSNVEISGEQDCWHWKTRKNRYGYGRFSVGLAPIAAHRASYRYKNDVIPDGMIVCHTCDNPACVNPSHLFLGTHKDNVDDMIRKDRNYRGSRCHIAKLTEQDIFAIKQKLIDGEFRHNLSKLYGVSYATIGYIALGKTWKHVCPSNITSKARNFSTKLTIEQVKEIKSRIQSGESNKEIAADYNVLPEQIRRIRTGERWKGIEM